MLLDHIIPKPPSLRGYDLHRLVQGLTDGASPLFVDMGENLIVRTENINYRQGHSTARNSQRRHCWV